MSRKSKYLEKSVFFGGAEVVLYSLDGLTWSSRKEELESIQARHDEEKANFSGQIKGGPQARKEESDYEGGIGDAAAAAADDNDENDDASENDNEGLSVVDSADEDDDYVDGEDDDEAARYPKSPAAPKMKPTGKSLSKPAAKAKPAISKPAQRAEKAAAKAAKPLKTAAVKTAKPQQKAQKQPPAKVTQIQKAKSKKPIAQPKPRVESKKAAKSASRPGKKKKVA